MVTGLHFAHLWIHILLHNDRCSECVCARVCVPVCAHVSITAASHTPRFTSVFYSLTYLCLLQLFENQFNQGFHYALQDSQVQLVVKNPPANVGDIRGTDSIPGSRRSPWAWQFTLVFLPGGFHGQRSLAGYSP